MINLLPKEQRESILYARRNTRLLRWCIGLVVVIALMIAMWGFGYFYIAKTSATYAKSIEQKRTDLKAQNLEETEQRIESFSNNLKLILQVFEKQVLFSNLLRQVGSVMPSGSILSNIEISEVEGGIDLSASAVDYDTATQIQVNLEDPANKLFEKVDIVKVSCGSDSASDQSTSTQNSSPASDSNQNDKYPCDVQLRALFTSDNPFLFINQSKSENGS